MKFVWYLIGLSYSLAFSEFYATKTLKKAALSTWEEQTGGYKQFHPWKLEYAGKHVFQEWIAYLESHRTLGIAARKKAGKDLETYVLQNNLKSLGGVGTSLPIPGVGGEDYDMVLLGCTSLLGLFVQDRDLLTDKTYVHLLKYVSILRGQVPKHYFEVLLLQIRETENHTFMIESTRYLNNQWIRENPRDLPEVVALRDSLVSLGVYLGNREGTLYQLLMKKMQSIVENGFFEFNARVYQRFTAHALNNLYSFSSDTLMVLGARSALDYMSAKFIFQSKSSVRLGPYRRHSGKFQEKRVWRSDAISSFFAAQTGALPTHIDEVVRYWKKHSSHRGMALFSSVLKYRIPSLLKQYARDTSNIFQTFVHNKAILHREEQSHREYYFLFPHGVVTAGGRYMFYRGPNFPMKYIDSFLDNAPWVYDVSARSSSLMLFPLSSEWSEKNSEYLQYRGEHWKGNNLYVYKNFIYGYAKQESGKPEKWPQQVPSHWTIERETRFETEFFYFRLLDVSKSGVYVLLSRLKPKKTWWKYSYQKYVRGTVEFVDTSWVDSWEEWIEHSMSNHKQKTEGYQYVLWDGSAISLNPQHNENNKGWENKRWLEHWKELLKVEKLSPKNLVVEQEVVRVDGKGTFKLWGAAKRDSLVIDFRRWWEPVVKNNGMESHL